MESAKGPYGNRDNNQCYTTILLKYDQPYSHGTLYYAGKKGILGFREPVLVKNMEDAIHYRSSIMLNMDLSWIKSYYRNALNLVGGTLALYIRRHLDIGENIMKNRKIETLSTVFGDIVRFYTGEPLGFLYGNPVKSIELITGDQSSEISHSPYPHSSSYYKVVGLNGELKLLPECAYYAGYGKEYEVDE